MGKILNEHYCHNYYKNHHSLCVQLVFGQNFQVHFVLNFFNTKNTFLGKNKHFMEGSPELESLLVNNSKYCFETLIN